MKQILQHLGTGETLIAEVPAPGARAGQLLIETRASLVSIGTERMLIDFGKAGWIEKARKQPDKVIQVLHKIKTDGLAATVQAVQSKLDQPITLGYCNVGTIRESAANSAQAFMQGDRVVSNGPHAEIVSVPTNLCAKIPEAVSDEAAAFTVIGAIGLQGIRLLNPTLGETVVVTGLGLIGLLCVQMLRAHGCRVIGIDFDSGKCALARSFGAETVDLSRGEDPISIANRFTNGRGVDGALITASTQSNEPVHQAALMCRKRGRIVLVGVVGLQLSRSDFYEKELSFQVSCSYGPGRYDEKYEQQGYDYPIGFVRWTEQRNFEAVLDLLADGRIKVDKLITHRFDFAEALQGYAAISDRNALGIILRYRGSSIAGSGNGHPARSVYLSAKPEDVRSGAGVVGVIGAGNFTGQVLLPGLRATGARLKTISSASGVTGTHLGKKFGFEVSTTDSESIFRDEEIDTIIVTTRHDSHARLVLQALRAGKNIYVEKPLCLTRAELKEISAAYTERCDFASSSRQPCPVMMVGFNRRFAPHVVKMKQLVESVREPKSFIMTVNAGAIPLNHWTQQPEVGGGRIIGEGCHYIDLLRFFAGAPIASVQAKQLGTPGDPAGADKVTFTLGFSDGSFGVVHYLANGHKSFPKERLEIFAAGRVLQLDNFRRLTGFGWPGFKKMNLWSQDKGHAAEMSAFIEAVRKQGPAPIPFDEIMETTRAAFDIVELLGGSPETGATQA